MDANGIIIKGLREVWVNCEKINFLDPHDYNKTHTLSAAHAAVLGVLACRVEKQAMDLHINAQLKVYKVTVSL